MFYCPIDPVNEKSYEDYMQGVKHLLGVKRLLGEQTPDLMCREEWEAIFGTEGVYTKTGDWNFDDLKKAIDKQRKK